MKFAVDIPNFGDWADPTRVADFARGLEEAGWDGFSIWDHILVADGLEVADPWISLAAAAAATDRITLMTMVTPLPRRTPWKLARECVTLDHLSGGRFILGVGIGWPNEPEFTRFGGPLDLRTRADMLDEGLAILEGLWSGEPFSFHGTHYDLAEVHFMPQPVQQPRIPIWVAGMWPRPRPFRRAARYDGLAPIVMDESGEFLALTPETMADIVAYTESHRSGPGPFDYAAFGCALEADDGSVGFLRAVRDAGATWWREGWFPGGVDHDVWMERALAGPPTL